jgi:glucose-1-phosphate thymidylyltransferase
MKGIVLAGGRGTRLRPFTYIIKKELLPVYDKPLIFYPLDTLRRSGVNEAIIVVDPKHVGAFVEILGDGQELGMSITYVLQNKPLGLAHAVLQAKQYIPKGESVMVIGGDNICEEDFKGAVKKFDKGALIVITSVNDPARFGVVSLQGDKVIRIEEKPEHPESNWVQTAIYMYDSEVFSIIDGLKPSQRGEYEITDINNTYIEKGVMGSVKTTGKWFDAGTFDSLLEASLFMAKKKNGNTTPVSIS